MNVLSGIRVLDASRVLAGPFCGQMLADLGAEVIKIERPGQGDDTRAYGPPFLSPQMSAYYLSCNRGKKAITLDLSRPEGLDLFYALLAKSDVVLENFRASSARKLGLSPEALLARNPRVIVCSISGFGRTGPWADQPGYDVAVQAMSGLMAVTGPVEGPPSKVGVAVADLVTGLYAGVAVSACLRARDLSGHGYAIDLALLDCALALQSSLAQSYLTTGQVPERHGNAHLQIVPYQAFATADGWLILAIGNDGQWQNFCRAAEALELSDDLRFRTNAQRVEQRSILVPLLEEIMKRRSVSDWRERLRAAQVPCAPVWNYAQVFEQEQVAARGMKLTIRDPRGQLVDLVGSPFHIAGAEPSVPVLPPEMGQDTERVLQELLGLSREQIEAHRRAGIV